MKHSYGEVRKFQLPRVDWDTIFYTHILLFLLLYMFKMCMENSPSTFCPCHHHP